MALQNDIQLIIHGDFGPFSRMGKSIGYQIEIGNDSFLIDCGSPLFQKIGGHGLKEIVGMVVTHCHDDHKRWFTDLSLFFRYAPDISRKVFLLTSESVYSGLVGSAQSALCRTLSNDSRFVVDMPIEDFIDYCPLGPLAKYNINSIDVGNGKRHICVTDRSGSKVDPDVAKVVINPATGAERMLFKDPECSEWVEPESFYPFSSRIFYEENRNDFITADGFTIRAIKAPVWHGVPGIGVRISKGNNSLIFGSDTVHNKRLWEGLYSCRINSKVNADRKGFEARPVIYGDINDYIERIWSRERYDEAIVSFDDAVVVHDISTRNNPVHTDYAALNETVLDMETTILTHSPDRLTSQWKLLAAGKRYVVKNTQLLEVVSGREYPLDADIYHKESGRYYVGYKDEDGDFIVYRKDGLLNLSTKEDNRMGELLFRINLYQDISGLFFPALDDDNSIYVERKDGKVELVRFNNKGSAGSLVSDQRKSLCEQRNTGNIYAPPEQ